jgi:hypothetical protein
MELKRRIKLNPVVAFRRSEQNPYMYGLQMKRDLTVKEACHIYRNIFLFDIDLSLNESDAEEKKEYYTAITEAMNNYIKGDIGWNTLCDETYCYDDDDTGASVASHLKLVEYLQKRGVL